MNSRRWPSFAQKRATFRRIGYEPSEAQRPAHAFSGQLVQVVGAEGGGKSQAAAAEALALLPWCDLIYLVGELYENTHQEFDYLESGLRELGALEGQPSKPKVGRWELSSTTGCRIITLSVHNGASAIIGLGEQPDLIVLCEAGIIRSSAVLLAAVRRVARVRGRVWLVGTLKDDIGWYAALSEELEVEGNPWDGATFSLPAWSNRALYPGGEDDPAIKRLREITPEDVFLRTVAAVRAPSQARVIPEFSYALHVRECPFDPARPVHLWIDPGWYPSAYAVVVVQFHGWEVWQIDEVYLHDHTHEQVIAECKTRPWWLSAYHTNESVIDVAGRQHHAQKSAIEVWGEAGLALMSQTIGILDGVNRHRHFLKRMRLFHDPRCVETLGEYRKYRKHVDKDGQVVSQMPVDAYNHAMKAIAYGLCWHFGLADDDDGGEDLEEALDVWRG